MADLNLKATISAQDDTRAAFSSLNESLNKTKDATDKAQAQTKIFGANVKDIGPALTDVGTKMTAGITLPIVGGMVLAVKSSMDFAQSMLELQTQAGASAGEVAKLSAQLLAMAGHFEQTPAEMAKALFPIESSGYRGAQALDVLTNSAKLASLGQTDLTQTANAVTTVMKAMPDSVKTSSDAVSFMNAIIGNGKMHLDDLNAAMSTGFLSAANTFGVSFQSIGSALAFMTNAGIPATDAATKLKMAVTLLAAPSTEQVKLLGAIGIGMTDAKAATEIMSEALKKGGVTQSQLASDLKKPDGLAVAIQDLKSHLEASGVSSVAAGDIIAKSFGGGRTGTAIMQMVNDTNGLKNTFDAVGVSAGNFGASVAAQAESPTAKWQETLARLNGALIDFGNTIVPVLIPFLTRLGDGIGKVTAWWDKLTPKTQEFVLVALGIVAAVGPVLVILGSIAAAITFLITPVGGVVVAIALFVTDLILFGIAIGTHLAQIKKFFIDAFDGIKQAWQMLKDFFTGGDPTLDKAHAGSKAWQEFAAILSRVRNDVITIWTAMGNAVTAVGNTIGAAVTAVVNFVLSIPGRVQTGWNNFVTGVHTAVTAIITFFSTLPDRLAYDLGFIAGRLVRFVTVDIPNFVTNTIKWLEQMRQDVHNKIVATFYDVLSWFAQLPDRVATFLSNLVTSVRDWFNRTHDAANQTAQKTTDAVVSWWNALPNRINTAVLNMWNTVATAFNNFRDSAKTWAKNTVDDIVKFFADLPKKIEDAVKNIGDKGKGVIKDLSGYVSKGYEAAISHQASGGPVSSNTPYIVGEQGPELFVPSQSGSIIPNNQLNGGGTNITINFHGDIMNTSNQNLDDIGRRLGKNIVQAIQGQAV